ncbi:MAG: sugar ABC transporter permease [Actinomycetota bacterium]
MTTAGAPSLPLDESTAASSTEPAPSSPIPALRRRVSEATVGYAMLTPMVVVVLGLIGYPLVLSIWFGFTDTAIGESGDFIGVDNYLANWNDPIFRRTLWNTFNYTVTAVVAKLVLGVVMAVLLAELRSFQRLWRGVFLMPWVVPSSLSVLGWVWMFDAQFSILTWLINSFGLYDGPIRWLGQPSLAMAAVQTVNIWRGAPFFGIMILAGMKTLPRDLLEAATVDGASAWQKFRHVTLPHLRPLLYVVTLFSFVQTMADFQIVWLLTKGGPQNSTHLIATLSFRTAIQTGAIGRGAAIALFLFPFLLLILALQLRSLRKANQ